MLMKKEKNYFAIMISVDLTIASTSSPTLMSKSSYFDERILDIANLSLERSFLDSFDNNLVILSVIITKLIFQEQTILR